jgi:hypothetical protein
MLSIISSVNRGCCSSTVPTRKPPLPLRIIKKKSTINVITSPNRVYSHLTRGNTSRTSTQNKTRESIGEGQTEDYGHHKSDSD